MKKPVIVFFSQYKLGGVQNYYQLLIDNDAESAFDKIRIFTKNINDTAALPIKSFQKYAREIVFPYDKPDKETLKALCKLIPRNAALAIANFHIELAALHYNNRGVNAIVHICHDDFFLDIACQFSFLIDVFIVHNYAYYKKLNEILPEQRKNDIYYLPYGISLSSHKRDPNLISKLKLFFLARFDKKKGVYDVFDIDGLLEAKGINVEWTLVGDGPEKDGVIKKAAGKNNFRVLTLPNTQAIYEMAAGQDVFVLPSYLDGLPLALLETMSVGLVPVISEFNEGIRRIVTEETGFVCGVGNHQEFAETLAFLDRNRSLIDKKGEAARKKIEAEFDIKTRAKDYYELFGNFEALRKTAYYKYKAQFGNNWWNYFKWVLKKRMKL